MGFNAFWVRLKYGERELNTTVGIRGVRISFFHKKCLGGGVDFKESRQGVRAHRFLAKVHPTAAGSGSLTEKAN